MRIALLALMVLVLCGCSPSGHITATYDPATGDVVGGVDVEIKSVLIETHPGSGKFVRRDVEVPHKRAPRCENCETTRWIEKPRVIKSPCE